MTAPGDLCPCNSGKTLADCHRDPRWIPSPEAHARAVAALEAHERSERERIEEFGHLKPIIHTDFDGKKIVAVGNTVHYSDKWRTFPDFLSSFIKTKIPESWYKSELAKLPTDRHPMVQWYVNLCEFQARHTKRNDDGLFFGEPDGPSLAFLALAHELFILEADQLLQSKLIARLLHIDQFQGARYEVTVASTMIRAGFTLTMEDESDSSTPHPEFIATHRATGVRVAVEAKSRHRAGVLGRSGTLEVGGNLADDLQGLFRKALRKTNDLPLFVFIDANLPSDVALAMSSGFAAQFQSMVSKVAQPINEHGIVVGHPHNLLMVTNIPFHYGVPGDSLPPPLFYSHWPAPEYCRHPVAAVLIRAVEHSLSLCGKIPNEFG